MDLRQITSNAYADPSAVVIDPGDFVSGSLRLVSFARPGKLFTANETLLTSEVGVLRAEAKDRIVDVIVAMLKSTP